MKALLSDKLRKIINDPEGIRELQHGMLKLSANGDSTGHSTVISVGNQKYKIQFVHLNPKDKK